MEISFKLHGIRPTLGRAAGGRFCCTLFWLPQAPSLCFNAQMQGWRCVTKHIATRLKKLTGVRLMYQTGKETAMTQQTAAGDLARIYDQAPIGARYWRTFSLLAANQMLDFSISSSSAISLPSSDRSGN
jgi:hypothetical protein